LKNNGGGTRIRTGDNGFAGRDEEDEQIAVNIAVAYMASICSDDQPSNQFPFVSLNPNIPDP
jgi:hypothetical protein